MIEEEIQEAHPIEDLVTGDPTVVPGVMVDIGVLDVHDPVPDQEIAIEGKGILLLIYYILIDHEL